VRRVSADLRPSSTTWGTTQRNVSQGGGGSISLSGGDERSEPESLTQSSRGVLPVAGNQPTRQK
jgi:hypothetical protein